MVTNIMPMKHTHQGRRHLKVAPKRINGAIDSFEAVGGKVVAFYAVIEGYDAVASVFLVSPTAQGNLKSGTAKGHSSSNSPP